MSADPGRMCADSESVKHFVEKRGKRRSYTEIRLDDKGELDEVVAKGVHLERMDDDAVWMDVGGVHVWFRAVKKGVLAMTWFEDNAKPFAVPPGEESSLNTPPFVHRGECMGCGQKVEGGAPDA